MTTVLYGLAVERVLGTAVTESRLSYCTRAGEFSERVEASGERLEAAGA